MVSCTTSQPPYLTSTYAGITLNLNFYRPQTKLRKGNVFTSVCQKFCPQNLPDPPPPSRRLLQRTLRILLECILVTCSAQSANYCNAVRQLILDVHTLAKIKQNLLTEHCTHKGSATFHSVLPSVTYCGFQLLDVSCKHDHL